ncbi:MAG: response regulator [Eubacteriales bacterium]|nr:response regulator [Eubacteriales bacterium]
MKTIIVEDELLMIRSFKRYSEGIESINLIGEFTYPQVALEFAKTNDVELAILDIAMPGMTGLELARHLREIRPEMLIVFITAYDEYIRESNEIGADYYILKPYKREVIEQMAERMKLLSKRQKKRVYIQTFGRFMVLKGGKPIGLSGKAKEILAIVVTKRGREISNGEIYTTIWEDRPYGNDEMKVYYNAIKRLKNKLLEAGLQDLLCSTTRGQMVNTDMFGCDYYEWLDRKPGEPTNFNGEFMSEYSWGEEILAEMIHNEN